MMMNQENEKSDSAKEQYIINYIKALPLAIMISIGGCGKLSTLDQSENFDLPRSTRLGPQFKKSMSIQVFSGAIDRPKW